MPARQEETGLLKSFREVFAPGEAEIVEKKSRFIAHIAPAHSEEEASAFIEKCRKEYWDARHNCHAFCVGTSPEISRCSDDGEPAQTAGKPMLDVIAGAGLKNTVAVVTRYFGGTLLGTGGLVRAYSSAVKAGLEACTIIEKRLCRRINIEADYSLVGKMQYIIGEEDVMNAGTQYGERASFDILVPLDNADSFQKKVADVTGGKAVISDHGSCYGAVADGQVMTFNI